MLIIFLSDKQIRNINSMANINSTKTTDNNCIESSNKFKYPSFLLCAPTTYSERIANNIWMKELNDEQRAPNHKVAMEQFISLYKALAAKSLVHLLPCPEDVPLQDLVFTANLGIVLSHLTDRKVAIVSNFTSEPRRGETEFGVKYFKSMGYETFVPETKFEGEADLKYLRDNIYIGGYGVRSELETYKWMEKMFDMKIICLKMQDEYLYHLDCSVFPLTPKKLLICKSLYSDQEIKSLGKVVEIIDVDYDIALSGICNCLRVGNVIFNSDNVKLFEPDSEDLKSEILKNNFIKKVAADNGLEVEFIELHEYTKSGALLSCMVLHMNRYNY
jgi:N-dimethylarginine dimethylaminohydrolase